MNYKRLLAGDTAPIFTQKTATIDEFDFDRVAGRFILLAFLGTAEDDMGANMFSFIRKNRILFDDEKLSFFGITLNKKDLNTHRLPTLYPGIRQFDDSDGKISRLYGSLPDEKLTEGQFNFLRKWVILDPMLRVHSVINVEKNGIEQGALLKQLQNLPHVNQQTGIDIQAPLLVLPRIFEHELCNKLKAHFVKKSAANETQKLNQAYDDVYIEESEIINALQFRIYTRVIPQITKHFHFQTTRIERFLLRSANALNAAPFSPQRENHRPITAHRRFSLKIYLNENYEGGEIYFPEFNSKSYKIPQGSALIYSSSLLHANHKMMSGNQVFFQTFLYDESAAIIREQNSKFLENVEV